MNHPSTPLPADLNRRQFLKGSSLAAAGVLAAGKFPFVIATHAAPDDPIRIGLIGCGGRGTGAVADALGAATNVIYPSAGYHTEDIKSNAQIQAKGVSVAALADVFPDRLKRCRDQIKNLNPPIEIPDDHCFTGFDAYKQLLALPDVNYVILATPPHFRPMHLKAAIEAGKNVFVEKPVAVDAPGVRMVIEAAELARQKGLGIAAGTQRRHLKSYNEAVKRLQDGAIGEILELRAYWNGGAIWFIEREQGWSDMESQLRNWNYFTWLGGDHIVEQHVHNLDIMNWIMGTHPVKAVGMGGRQARGGKEHGHIYDHFAVEYEYPNGVRMFSQCRQMAGTDGKVEEAAVGTGGYSNCQNYIKPRQGELWRFRRENDPNPYHQEHTDLIASIRAGKPINEAKAIAESTMTGILGRESAYSGRTLEWDTLCKSDRRLGPARYEMGDLPFPEIPIPGKYQAG
jgi:predicted dehydrogenase